MMRRISAFFIAFLLLFSLCACTGAGEQPSSQPTETQPEAPKSLKVLAIGNSFSEDALEHLYAVAKAQGVEEVVLGNLYVGGCTLQMHASYVKNNEPKYRYDKNTGGTWVKTPDTTFLTGLQDEQWDVITMQQGSADSGLADSHQPYLDQLVDYVLQNKTNPNGKLMWHMTWAYQEDSTHKAFPTYGNNQMSMYYGIVNVLQKVIEPKDEITGVLPVGTVIQNLRTSVIGDKLTRDGHHLNDFGRIAASYTWYAVLSGQKLYDIQLDGAASVTLTQDQKDLIIHAVNAALEKPHAVTSI